MFFQKDQRRNEQEIEQHAKWSRLSEATCSMSARIGMDTSVDVVFLMHF
jgi:hypothetical protein